MPQSSILCSKSIDAPPSNSFYWEKKLVLEFLLRSPCWKDLFFKFKQRSPKWKKKKNKYLLLYKDYNLPNLFSVLSMAKHSHFKKFPKYFSWSNTYGSFWKSSFSINNIFFSPLKALKIKLCFNGAKIILYPSSTFRYSLYKDLALQIHPPSNSHRFFYVHSFNLTFYINWCGDFERDHKLQKKLPKKPK